MALHWKTVRNMHAGNQVTDFRLSRSTNHYPTDPESIWWSALVDLSGISINDFEAQVLASYPQDLLIPNDYDHYDRAQVSSRQIVAIFARRILLNSLNQNGANFSVTGVHLGSIIDPELLDFDAQIEEVPLAKKPVSKGTIITAVIDDSIAFAHNLFRDGLTSTRVAFANILTVKPNRSGRDKTYGRTYDKAAIDELLKTCTTNDLLDEQKFYASVGLFDAHDNEVSSVALRRSHGTHVMALATGYSMSQPPPDRPIICALLPSHATQDSTGQSTLPSLILALKRIQRQAAQFRLPDRKRPPVVVNFSYGNFGGPHDGTGPIDRVIAQYFGDDSPRKFDQEMRLVLPAGNGNLERIHAKLAFDKGAGSKSRTLDFVALPDDRTASHVQMWMPYSGAASIPPFVSIRATVPGGPTSDPVVVGGNTQQQLCDGTGKELARLAYSYEHGETQRGLITFSLNPTASLSASDLARAGRWQIEITPLDITASQSVDVWIERDETLPGFSPGGKQGYFNNPDYVVFDALGAPLPVDPPHTESIIRRAGTLSGYACGQSPMVVAAFTQSNRLLSDYSAAGPITPPRDASEPYRLGPDAAALADDSPVLTGVISAGSSSGSMVRMGGTSSAAPRVARLAVSAISKGAAGDRKWLWETAKSHGEVAKTRTGGGQVDVTIDFTGLKPNGPIQIDSSEDQQDPLLE